MEFQWNKVADGIPSDGRRVLLAAADMIFVSRLERDADGVFARYGLFGINTDVFFWADIPPVPTIVINGRDGGPGESGEPIVIAGDDTGPVITNLVVKGGDGG